MTTIRPTLDRPEGPVLPAEPHPADRRLSAEQTAINDHGSGAFDEFYFLQLDGPLPYEVHVDAETARLRSVAGNRREESDLTATALIEQYGSHGEAGVGLLGLHSRRQQVEERRSQVRHRRAEHVAVLDGDREDGSGRNRTGPVPTGRRPLLWAVRQHLLTAVLVVLEIVALYAVFAYTLAADNPWDVRSHPDVTTTALLGAVVVIGLPIVLGVMLRGHYRNAEHRPAHTAGRVAAFLLIGAGWLTAVWLMALARAEAFGAPTTTSLNDTGGPTAVAGLAELMFVLFTLLGLGTIWHQARHNWHRDEVVQANRDLHRLDREANDLDQQIESVTSRLRVQESVRATEHRIWTEHVDVTLPAVGEELKTSYRNELVRRMGDPLLTGALGTTGAPPAPADADRPALWALPGPQVLAS